jgi:hypothetical protein
MALAVAQEDLRLSWLAVAHRGGQRTERTAQERPAAVDVIEYVVEAEVANDVARRVPGQALGAVVPVADPTSRIDVVHAIEEIVHDGSLELLEGRLASRLRIATGVVLDGSSVTSRTQRQGHTATGSRRRYQMLLWRARQDSDL